MKKSFGFTLAEVLITLGIIGVVAAMTMPTLLANTQGAQFKTAFKKELSTLNQAVLMQFAMEDTDFSNLVNDDGTSAYSGNGIMMSGILTSRLQAATDITEDYFNAISEVSVGAVEEECTQEQVDDENNDCEAVGDPYTVPAQTYNATNAYVYSFADGTAFGYLTDDPNNIGCTENNVCHGFLDVNGITKPNQITICEDVEDGDATKCEPSEIHDIFPVNIYGQTVEPASKSVRAVLTNK